MRTAGAFIACLILHSATALAGQATPTPATPLPQSVWHVDFSGAALHEAWDFNGNTETLGGVFFGFDRKIWSRVAFRVEAPVLHVNQDGDDAWLLGYMVGTRFRWRPGTSVVWFAEILVGVSKATNPTPPRGTEFNYLALIGGGVEIPFQRTYVSVTGRWFHVSNNGPEGTPNNPDIQSLGVLVGVGWRW